MERDASVSEGDSQRLLDEAPAEVKTLIAEAEARQWRLHVKRRGALRYWCPGPCRHQTWIELHSRTVDYVERTRIRLIRTTCWEEDTP